MYDYTRWHLLGIAGWYANFHKEGKIGCQKALETHPGSQIDRQNLNIYEQKEAQDKPKPKKLTRKEFTDAKYKELSQTHPTLKSSKIMLKIKKMWKDYINENPK